MADIVLNTIGSLLYDMRGPMQSLYPTRNFLLAYFSGEGQDGAPGRITPLNDPTRFDGKQVRVPLDTAMMQAGGWIAESGTVNQPIPPVITQAQITLKKFIQPFGISLEAMEDSRGSNSAIDATAMSLQKARIAMADAVNLAFCGDGTGKLAGVTTADSSLTKVLPAGTDWDKIYVGQVVDFVDATTGASTTNGKRRRIATVNPSTSTITIDTAQQASDGESGNVTTTANTVLVPPGSVRSVGGVYTSDVLQGGFEAAGRGTSFEGVTLATYPQFKAVDGRGGDNTTAPLSDGMIDLGTTLAQRAGDGLFDAAFGDPNAINIYKNAKANQTRFSVSTGVVAGHFTGIQIDLGNQIITVVPERKTKPGSVKFFARAAATLYGSTPGPDYDDLPGSMFKQFNRQTNYEVWLKDRIELGWHNPSKMVYYDNLSVQNPLG